VFRVGLDTFYRRMDGDDGYKVEVDQVDCFLLQKNLAKMIWVGEVEFVLSAFLEITIL
jgi:hypothetical protein